LIQGDQQHEHDQDDRACSAAMVSCLDDGEHASSRAAAARSNKRSPPGSDRKVCPAGTPRGYSSGTGERGATAAVSHILKLHGCCWFPAVAPDSRNSALNTE
jgi:hypothetical protein